jgi:DUF1680 family protein
MNRKDKFIRESIINSRNISLKNIKIEDKFWSKYESLVRDEMIPYQWAALNDEVEDAEPSHAIKNFRIAAGLEDGEYYGMVFQDSDVAKWLEAVAYSIETNPDEKLESLADEVIDVIEKAQMEDGYLNTYFTVKEPGKRWTNLRECHELYCAGHMMEAAVAYYNATDKRKFLDVMCKFAGYIDSVFGPEEGKLKGYPGHQVIELALVKLYRVTGEERYLNLAKYFLNERGKKPFYFDIEKEKKGYTEHFVEMKNYSREYAQTHLPVREQTTAEGHGVRALYMYTGMAEVAAETGDKELYETCKTIWNNIVNRRMYITAGIGSMAYGEAFSFDYDLPNDTVYAETCASIALVFFANKMLQIEADSNYADVMERALYNGTISGMSLDGKRFFYVNPLEVWPEASKKNQTKFHVKPVRQKWFGCACCPPNLARMLASLGQYIYTVNDKTIYTHLYIGGETEIKLGEEKIKLIQETNYPWNDNVKIKVSLECEKEFNLAVRIPGWCHNAKIYVNSSEVDLNSNLVNGYVILNRVWKKEDVIELKLDMPVELIEANPYVREDAGKVAIQRGPIVYCLEEVDNGNNLSSISIAEKQEFLVEFDENLLGGVSVIKGRGFRRQNEGWKENLYRPYKKEVQPVEIKAIPYALWGNRNPGEMQVWIRLV